MSAVRAASATDARPEADEADTHPDPFAMSVPATQPTPRSRSSGETHPLAPIRVTRGGTVPIRAGPVPARAATRPADDGSLDDSDHAPDRVRAAAPVAGTATAIASIHATIGALAALIGAVLVLDAQLLAQPLLVGWVLALIVLAGGSGALAYALAQHPRRVRGAGLALAAGQLAMLCWALGLVGPRAALLLFVPPMALLALRIVGPRTMSMVAALAVALYVAALVLAFRGLVVPVLPLAALWRAVLSGAAAAMGLMLTLAGLAGLVAAQTRAAAVARARQYEAHQLRARLAHYQQAVEADSDQLYGALSDALHRRRAGAIASDGPLGLLVTSVNAAAQRLATLHRDREDRLRLEGALRVLIRAVERSWLGLAWAWPDPSGTLLDELVALLRAPRAQLPDEAPADDAAALVPIPSLEALRARQAADAEAGGVPVVLRRRARYALPEVEPPEQGISSSRWNAWD